MQIPSTETSSQVLLLEGMFRHTTVRVASLNIWGWFGDWELRKQIIADAWARIDADILLLQEGCARRGVDQIDELANILGYAHQVKAVGERDARGTESVAILSRYPFQSVMTETLPNSNPACAMAWAKMNVHGISLRVGTAHLCSDIVETRDIQLASLLNTPVAHPVIIGGTMNAGWEDINAFCEGWEDGMSDPYLPTWPTDRKYVKKMLTSEGEEVDLEDARRDYLLSQGLEIIEGGRINLKRGDTYASDHFLVWSDYLIRDARTKLTMQI